MRTICFLFMFCTVHFSTYADVFGWDKKEDSPNLPNANEAKVTRKKSNSNHYRQNRQSFPILIPKKISVNNVVAITKRDINTASAKGINGYVIDQPGLYKLCEDIDWCAKFPNSYAITIASDNVSLDLDGHLIVQRDTSLSGNFAIQVAPGRKFIFVHNGILQKLSGGGIFVKEGASCIKIDGIQCDKSCYKGGQSLGGHHAGTHNLTAGILFFGAESPFLDPFDPRTFISPNPVQDITVTNCSFCDLGILDGSFIPDCIIAGIGTTWTNSITVENIHVDRVFSEFQASPLSFSFGNDLVVSHAVLTNLTSLVSIMAVYVDVFKGAVIEDVVASNMLTTVADHPEYTGSRGAEGAKIGATTNAILRRSSFENIAIVNEVPALVPSIARASAVSLDGASFVQISECSAKNISNSDGWAYGFGSNPDGFFPFLPVPVAFPDRLFANTFTDCFIENVSVSGAGNYAAGLNLNYTDGQAINCTVSAIHDERPNPQAYGIILTLNPEKVDSTAVNCLIANNRINNCDTYGIFDNTLAIKPRTKNIINSNYAYKNGAGGNVNYLVNTSVTPIRVWHQATKLPDPTDNNGILDATLDNIDVQNN